MQILSLKKVTKNFIHAQNTTHVIKNATFNIKAGQICSLIGPSGCGKSTLLHIAGLLESPSSGILKIDGHDCSHISDAESTAIRGKKIGFVYQAHHLLPEFSAAENIMIPLLINGIPSSTAREKATAILEDFNLLHRSTNLPSELSGGEQQRVAIARALITQPKLLLADEPTGNLDEQNADIVFSQFLKIVRQRKVSVLMVTHNLEIAKKTDRIFHIDKGIVESN